MKIPMHTRAFFKAIVLFTMNGLVESQSCSPSKQDCKTGEYCNGDSEDSGECSVCWKRMCEVNSTSEVEKVKCDCDSQSKSQLCSASQQDCPFGEYCNSGKCSVCWVTMCEIDSTSEGEKAKCDCSRLEFEKKAREEEARRKAVTPSSEPSPSGHAAASSANFDLWNPRSKIMASLVALLSLLVSA